MKKSILMGLLMTVLMLIAPVAHAEEIVRPIFVTPEWAKTTLEQAKENNQDVKIFEVSWGTEEDSPTYLKEHIPGAVHINTDTVEEAPVWNLRKAEEIEKSLLDYGIDKDTMVILYSDSTAATRIAFVYLWAGVENVRIIDGGLSAWKAAGYDVESTVNKPVAVKDFKATVPVHPEYVMSLEEVQDALEHNDNFRLVSMRSEQEYDGRVTGYSYINRAGEVEGAVWGMSRGDSQVVESYHHEDQTVITYDEMLILWEERGEIKPTNDIAFYCGTGWRANIPWLLLYEQGIDAKVYDGGWNEWQMNGELPVQVGDPHKEVKHVKVKDLPEIEGTKR